MKIDIYAGIRGHKILTKELLKRFEQIGSQEHSKDPIIIAKYFHAFSSWYWYATEYNQENELFFGYVIGHEVEWGYWSLADLTENLVNGLPFERDLYFKEIPFSELK